MIKTRITFDVTDLEYFRMLRTYISLNYSEVIVIDENDYDFIVSDKPEKSDQRIVIASHDFDIFKYQKASKICSLIINYATKDEEQSDHVNEERTAKLVSVTSAAGGAGKTLLSQNLCVKLAEMHQKVLYVSLDSLSAMEGIFSDENENDISKLQYYLSLDRDVNKSVEAIKGHDSISDVYFIRSLYPSLEVLQDPKMMRRLVSGLQANTVYQYVVFDIPAFMTPASVILMSHTYLTLFINRYDSDREKTYLKFLAEKTGKNIRMIQHGQDIDSILGMVACNGSE